MRLPQALLTGVVEQFESKLLDRYIFRKTTQWRLIITSAEDFLDSLAHLSNKAIERYAELGDYHLARHNGWTDIQLSDTFSHNRKETGGKKGSQFESVDRQLTDVIRPSSRLGGLEKVGRGYTLSWPLSVETGLSSGYRNLMPRGASEAPLEHLLEKAIVTRDVRCRAIDTITR